MYTARDDRLRYVDTPHDCDHELRLISATMLSESKQFIRGDGGKNRAFRTA